MPAPLVWLGIGLITTLAGKAAYDSYNSRDDDDDDWEDQQAAARRENERAAEQAQKAEEQRLAREHQQRLSHYARQQLGSLVDKHSLGHSIDEQLVGQALNNRAVCKAKLLAMYDSTHTNDSASDRERQAIGKLQQLYAQLEG